MNLEQIREAAQRRLEEIEEKISEVGALMKEAEELRAMLSPAAPVAVPFGAMPQLVIRRDDLAKLGFGKIGDPVMVTV